ncbi:MAG: Sapep family Mn(2+)-dependent dipeptidase [Clostridia bacterium]|nr:Sapep family Mn(2+)-dependent dipeptidase [Clostridia bacterium]
MDSKQIVLNNFDEMVATLQKVITFDTVKSAALPCAPFGKGNRECLSFVLDLAKSWGLDTYDDQGYAGHIDLKGSGDEVLGILGHLDVVPAKESDGWAYPPFAAQIADGKLFGRGTMDDKGPMIACLYAVKALKESGFVPSKTIRLIFGCDEESGMECVNHYFSTMPKPQISFSPDGDFPVINREKGIFQFEVNLGKIDSAILDVYAGERTNVVAGKCVTKLAKTVDVSAVANLVEEKEDCYLLTTLGKNAHGSTPQEGVNATWQAFEALHKLFPSDKAIAFVANKMLDYTGASWGIDLHDEPSGDLTCNIGIVRVEEGCLKIGVDIRFPVTYTCHQMHELLKKQTPFAVAPDHISEPLFVPADSFLVETLLSVYDDAMGGKSQPLAIGGGTYSRCLPNCVAFGPLFPGEEQTIHMPNEAISLQNLQKMALIYLDAIQRLSK